MSLLYLLLKALHEFAHALTIKVWGGEVREMGISLLVLAPIPYVDASAAWQFREKSKLVFNANPLLKFDGYYVLQDLLEIPNLYGKSRQYFLYLLQRYLLGANLEHSPAQDNRERFWLLGYAIAAFFYRMFLLL